VSDLFRVLGVSIGCYAAYALVAGVVYAKSGVLGRSFRRSEDGLGYGSAIGAYTLLSVAPILWL
jgi:hypothetical protein